MSAFYFISIPRTASDSMHKALGTGKMYNHMTAHQMRTSVGFLKWWDAFKFAFVRNPWARAVSWFCYHKAQRNRDMYNLYSFHEWLILGMPTHFATEHPQLADPIQQHLYITARPIGRTLVDFVGRYEHLDRDWAYVCERIGRSPTPKLRQCNDSHSGDYRRYYEGHPSDVDAVAAICKRDIELFGYQFGGM